MSTPLLTLPIGLVMSSLLPVALAILSSQQDLAPDNLQFADKFAPSPMPIPGITKFA